ncbi:MAG: TRAP transporter permease, partial [Clostridia bacterium]|nr:TRAP transporter permease [Clostridia bacterium]
IKTALTATKLAIAAFIVPYAFAMNPVMLFIDVTGPMQVILIVVTSLIGIFGVSSSLEGWLLTHMNPVQRIMAAAGGLLLIDPSPVTDIIGVTLVAAVAVWQFIQTKQFAKKTA